MTAFTLDQYINILSIKSSELESLVLFYNNFPCLSSTLIYAKFDCFRHSKVLILVFVEPSRRDKKNIFKLIAHCRIQKHWNFITEDRQTFGVLRLIHIKFEFIWWPELPCDFVSIESDIHCVARKILKLSYISGNFWKYPTTIPPLWWIFA